MLSRAAGTRNFLLTNAAGGLRPWHQLGDVMLIRDHVNLTSQNPLVGTTPVRFPDMSGAYDREWRQSLMQKFKDVGLVVHEGIYLGLLGPSFETPAEIELFSKWGIDAVGMSTVWEAIALKDSGARFAALSLISNAAAGLGDGLPLEHEKILEVCRSSAERVVLAIAAWLESERA
jgi:purine-nucleoside phosphorylase